METTEIGAVVTDEIILVVEDMTEIRQVEGLAEMTEAEEEAAVLEIDGKEVPSPLYVIFKFVFRGPGGRYDERGNPPMNNAAYGPPLPPRERRSRWDPTPKHGGPVEKNFYNMHPDVAQRQEVSM